MSINRIYALLFLGIVLPATALAVCSKPEWTINLLSSERKIKFTRSGVIEVQISIYNDGEPHAHVIEISPTDAGYTSYNGPLSGLGAYLSGPQNRGADWVNQNLTSV